jgi:hypothetical protein
MILSASCAIVALIAVIATLPAQADPVYPNTQKLEGKETTAQLLRHQQAYYLETSAFAKTVDDLRMANNYKIKSYRYQMTTFTQAKQPAVMILSRPTKSGRPTYVGLVRIVDAGNQEMTSMATMCESTRSAAINVTPRSIPQPQVNGTPTCPSGFRSLSN